MIYYLGYYSCSEIENERRVASPPAMNKMNYVISSLSEVSDDSIVVVTPCETISRKYVKGTSISLINNNVTLKTFDSFFSKNKLIRCFGHVFTKLQLYIYLFLNINKNDTLIVYHSLALMKVVSFIKASKKCNLIIEVEELYSDVKEDSELRKKEIQFLQIADKYIVITEMLNKDINLSNKPSIISHGTYKVIPRYCGKFNDGKIHVVYAGSFNPVKGGAYSAIEAAAFLNDKYVVHILGKGSIEQIELIKQTIKKVSLQSKCKIVFEGFKTGKEFDSFIQACHIGLSTQQPDGKYNASSFPSKILMYMSNGLPVVSVKIPAVERSSVGKYIYYYDYPVPNIIADAIRNVPIGEFVDPIILLNNLNSSFLVELKSLISPIL